MCSHTFSTQVNLRDGVPNDCVNTTCTAGAGTMVLEFGILSRLLGDPVYESYARRAVDRLWGYRSNVTGLLGMKWAWMCENLSSGGCEQQRHRPA